MPKKHNLKSVQTTADLDFLSSRERAYRLADYAAGRSAKVDNNQDYTTLESVPKQVQRSVKFKTTTL